MDTFDWDESTERAWAGFQAALAEHLLGLEDDGIVLLEVEGCEDQDGAAPYVQFCRFDDEIRCEAVSNAYLAAPYRIDGASGATLSELGFADPTYTPDEEPDAGSSNFWLDAVLDDADRLAWAAVRALRLVYGVAHPALLAGHPFQPAPVEEVASEETPDVVPEVLYPHGGAAELDAFVVKALTPYFGAAPTRDDDGDIPVTAGTSVVYLRVLPDQPVVRLFSELVVDVKDVRAARREVQRLNEEYVDLKFLVRGDSIRCSHDVDAWPLATEHLEARLSRICAVTSSVDHEVADKVAGRVFNPAAEPDLPVEADVLDPDHLLWENVDRLTPAELGEQPVATLLRLVMKARQARSAWASELRSAQRSSAPWVAACREEHRSADRRHRRLRRVLTDAISRQETR